MSHLCSHGITCQVAGMDADFTFRGTLVHRAT
jgi:hypothetical protein